MAEAVLLEVVEAVDGGAAARQRDALHVAALRAPRGEDALLGEHVERKRVDALLVDEHERFAVRAHLALELDDLADLIVGELALRLDQLLALRGVRVVEPGGDLGLFVLERHVAREDVAVRQALGHVRVPRPATRAAASGPRRAFRVSAGSGIATRRRGLASRRRRRADSPAEAARGDAATPPRG